MMTKHKSPSSGRGRPRVEQAAFLERHVEGVALDERAMRVLLSDALAAL